MHPRTKKAIIKNYSNFNLEEVFKFYLSDKNPRIHFRDSMVKINDFYKRFNYECQELSCDDLLHIHEKLCLRIDRISHPSVIDKSLYDIFAKTEEESYDVYTTMCKNKTTGMVQTLANNPDYAKVGDLDALIRRYGIEEGTDRYEKFRETQRYSSKRSIKYWLSLGFTEEEATQEISKIQSTFSLEICIEKYGKEKGMLVWQDRQDRWQNTLNSKPQEEKDAINKKKSMTNNTERYREDNQAIIYLIELPNKHLKIGITNKETILGRYSGDKLQDCNVVYNQKFQGNYASMIELIIKAEFSEFIIDKSEQIYEQFGYTETFKNIDKEKIIDYINWLCNTDNL